MTRAFPIPEAATLADALDCLDAGLFLVEDTGRILHANASGNAMLHRRSVLRAADGKLVACEENAAQALKETVAKVATDGARASAVALPASDGEHCLAHVLPLAAGARRSGGACGDAIAALLVRRVALDPPVPPEAIAGLYGLTPGEVRVLLAIVEVGGVRETAESLGVGEATVKTHLHRLFGKTGTTRQADLVKLVAGFANPVAGRSCRPEQPADGLAQRGRTVGIADVPDTARPARPANPAMAAESS